MGSSPAGTSAHQPTLSRLARVNGGAYALQVRLVAPLLCIASLLCSACAEESTSREWQPEDHQEPSGEVDPSQAAPLDEGEGVARAAAALWRQSCASCHGPEGRGDGRATPPGITVQDLTTGEFQDSRSDEEMAQVIREGQGAMPGFGSQINERGVDALVAHIRTLRAD